MRRYRQDGTVEDVPISPVFNDLTVAPLFTEEMPEGVAYAVFAVPAADGSTPRLVLVNPQLIATTSEVLARIVEAVRAARQALVDVVDSRDASQQSQIDALSVSLDQTSAIALQLRSECASMTTDAAQTRQQLGDLAQSVSGGGSASATASAAAEAARALATSASSSATAAGAAATSASSQATAASTAAAAASAQASALAARMDAASTQQSALSSAMQAMSTSLQSLVAQQQSTSTADAARDATLQSQSSQLAALQASLTSMQSSMSDLLAQLAARRTVIPLADVVVAPSSLVTLAVTEKVVAAACAGLRVTDSVIVVPKSLAANYGLRSYSVTIADQITLRIQCPVLSVASSGTPLTFGVTAIR